MIIERTFTAVADNWNTTFAPAKFALSNSDLTATTIDINHADTIIGTVSHSTGKWYFELEVESNNSADLGWGLSSAVQSNASPGWDTGIQYRNNTNNWRTVLGETRTGMTPFDSTHPNVNDWLGFAVDFDNFLIWIRNATQSPTSWWGNNGSGDPVTGSNGLLFNNYAGTEMFLSFTSNANGDNQSVTMNTGGSAFIANAPTGYTAWENVPINAALYSAPRRNRTYRIRYTEKQRRSRIAIAKLDEFESSVAEHSPRR